MNVWYLIVLLIAAYLLGSVPTSVWLGRLFFGVDVRKSGSGNAGATNTIRVLGWKAGLPVLIIDILKGFLAVNLFILYNSEGLNNDGIWYLKTGLAIAAVAGHIFPVYIGFKGGRGVATLLGIGIALYPVCIWFVLGVFVVVLLISKIVSLASIVASVSLPVFVFALFSGDPPILRYLSLAIAVFIPLTHLSNIKRLLKGEEKKFRFKKDTTAVDKL